MSIPNYYESIETQPCPIKSVGMRIEKVTTDFSVPLKILWLTRNIWC
jgi:hypothetical protein